ncbi:C40 family peptidase [Herbidospora cretacea]|uniref:C40 family peptidase n=1 Tax=Herbidospora cretacea TaxID=28444 RepID=UPI000A81FE04|nr:NlpC/P60 family protein [Herbidospora cretacea]
MPVDQAAGILAPGVMSPTDFGFDALPELPEPAIPDVSGKRQAIIDDALTQIGKWYVWGGESDAEGGFDCSGLLFWAFTKNGVDIPRVSGAQAARGKRVDITKLRPGDLVAWENNPEAPGADHIALYLGDGWILEAPRTGLKVRKRKLRANEGAWGVAMDY